MKTILLLVTCVGSSVFGSVEFYLLKGSYSQNQNVREIHQYSNLENMVSGVSTQVYVRNYAQGPACEISIDSNGRVYVLTGNPTIASPKTIRQWNSISEWMINENPDAVYSRETASSSSGFSIYQNEVYIFEGSVLSPGTTIKNLVKWSSLDDWSSGVAGAVVGTRTMGTGASLAMEIAPNGELWLIDHNGSLAWGSAWNWPTIGDFVANTNTVFHSTFFFFSDNDEFSGLAIIPEPSSLSLLLAGGAVLMAGRRLCRV